MLDDLVELYDVGVVKDAQGLELSEKVVLVFYALFVEDFYGSELLS